MLFAPEVAVLFSLAAFEAEVFLAASLLAAVLLVPVVFLAVMGADSGVPVLGEIRMPAVSAVEDGERFAVTAGGEGLA